MINEYQQKALRSQGFGLGSLGAAVALAASGVLSSPHEGKLYTVGEPSERETPEDLERYRAEREARIAANRAANEAYRQEAARHIEEAQRPIVEAAEAKRSRRAERLRKAQLNGGIK